MTMKTCEPDYLFWSKLDSWNFKDAALLLEGMNPFDYKAVKFTLQEMSQHPELEAAYKTYLILKNTDWEQRCSGSHANPYQIYVIAKRKDLPIPEALTHCLRKRYQREQDHNKQLSSETVSDESLTTRERRNLLKLIGYMALLIADFTHAQYQFSINGRPNTYQIMQALLDKAIQLNKDSDGMKSSNRKMKEALAFLADED